MASVQLHRRITEAEYLAGERVSDIKHELISGNVYAMTGESRNHNIIVSNIARQFGNYLQDTPCITFASDLKVKILSDFFYPDILVTCEDNGDDYFTETPIIIVEVLSKSTRRRDKTTKVSAYQSIAALQEYVLIEQDFIDVEVQRRPTNWLSEHYFLGDEVLFEAIDLKLAVADIYQRVNNEEMREFLQQQTLT